MIVNRLLWLLGILRILLLLRVLLLRIRLLGLLSRILWLLLRRSWLGRAIVAVRMDRDAAALMGVRVEVGGQAGQAQV